MTDKERLEVFTPEQVRDLNKYQNVGNYHPYTCANRGDGKHYSFNGDLGGLVATTRGWICPYCDYVQDWAHDVPAEPKQVYHLNAESVETKR